MFHRLNFTARNDSLNLTFRLFACSSDPVNMEQIIAQLDHIDFWFNAITRNQDIGDEEYSLCWYVPYSQEFIDVASEDAFLYGWINCYTDFFMYCLSESTNAKSVGATLNSLGIYVKNLNQYVFVEHHDS